MFLFDVANALVVRLVLLVHALLVIWLAESVTHNSTYWLLAIAIVGMVIEAAVTIGKNRAQEWKWFCPCFLSYLCSTIPGIWVLELNRMEALSDNKDSNNATSIRAQALDDIQGIHFPIEMETNTWVMITEQLFLYLIILARWILPRGEISRDELSQLLFVFIGIAGDISELFALFEERKVLESPNIMYAILCIWTFSLVQFTFVLTSTHNPIKSSAGPTFTAGNEELVQDEAPGQRSFLAEMFQTEVWSICVNFLFQDGPFLAIRLYIMVGMKLLTYSIIFFTAKNALLTMLLFYRVIVVCCERKRKVASVSEMSPDDSKHSLQMVEEPPSPKGEEVYAGEVA
ncbi:transmembrane protein 26-like [Dreissena polymorpha]|uniref:Transmembrane protein 26 n=1 Tax=Dreissena polymorpha TaxID=45954 RepID=A0A9D4M6G3_DREPO|nr:transmembrane protein 26-like [Dreissena polymorpha]KAH3871777.1 hypothetical protein DPMN_034991 [Dreissena polymorpha]